jgi:predicted nuclease of restriction endonuclease-like (RecB) superfamily
MESIAARAGAGQTGNVIGISRTRLLGARRPDVRPEVGKARMSAARRKSSSKPSRVGKPASAFKALVDAVRRVHDECAAAASRTVNTTLTLRNWAIGYYIDQYELHGADRAKYGDGVIAALATALAKRGITRCDERELYRYLVFHRTYPQIVEAASPLLPAPSVSARARARVAIPETASPLSNLPAARLLERLSFSHFAELIELDDPLKRAFYEVECLAGNWSVRALKRNIATLYFERSGLSTNKKKLAALANAAADKTEPRLAIRDPYVFEFLGLRSQDAVTESELEAALLDNLHAFLMELGHGFCLEARQKSIIIGKTRGFVDLVFYHRVLKCHVLIELKVDKLTHEHLGQLNTYVSWYRKHMMTKGDNPPVGLLLCTQKDHVLVEYATANMDNRLFVSKYQLELPRKEELERFLQGKRAELAKGGGTAP